MTTYCKYYKLTTKQKSLLKILLIYQICKYIVEKSYGRLLTAKRLFSEIKSVNFEGDDSVMIIMEDIIKLCKSIPKITKKRIKKYSELENRNIVLIIISIIYSNKTIEGLQQSLSSLDDIHLVSTSSYCS